MRLEFRPQPEQQIIRPFAGLRCHLKVLPAQAAPCRDRLALPDVLELQMTIMSPHREKWTVESARMPSPPHPAIVCHSDQNGTPLREAGQGTAGPARHALGGRDLNDGFLASRGHTDHSSMSL